MPKKFEDDPVSSREYSILKKIILGTAIIAITISFLTPSSEPYPDYRLLLETP